MVAVDILLLRQLRDWLNEGAIDVEGVDVRSIEALAVREAKELILCRLREAERDTLDPDFVFASAETVLDRSDLLRELVVSQLLLAVGVSVREHMAIAGEQPLMLTFREIFIGTIGIRHNSELPQTVTDSGTCGVTYCHNRGMTPLSALVPRLR